MNPQEPKETHSRTLDYAPLHGPEPAVIRRYFAFWTTLLGLLSLVPLGLWIGIETELIPYGSRPVSRDLILSGGAMLIGPLVGAVAVFCGWLARPLVLSIPGRLLGWSAIAVGCFLSLAAGGFGWPCCIWNFAIVGVLLFVPKPRV